MEDLKEKILNLDLDIIVQRLIKKHKWNSEDANECKKLYKNFLYLMGKYSGKQIVIPTEEIDIFWHEHILHTDKYTNDCISVFGSYMHHDPYIEQSSDKIQIKTIKTLFDETQELHKNEFGYYIYDIRISIKKVFKDIFKKYFN